MSQVRVNLLSQPVGSYFSISGQVYRREPDGAHEELTVSVLMIGERGPKFFPTSLPTGIFERRLQIFKANGHPRFK